MCVCARVFTTLTAAQHTCACVRSLRRCTFMTSCNFRRLHVVAEINRRTGVGLRLMYTVGNIRSYNGCAIIDVMLRHAIKTGLRRRAGWRSKANIIITVLRTNSG